VYVRTSTREDTGYEKQFAIQVMNINPIKERKRERERERERERGRERGPESARTPPWRLTESVRDERCS